MTHIVKFLSAIRNSRISKRIAEQRIPEGMTLQDLFMKALDFEAGLQMSEGVTQKREAEIMEVNDNNSQGDEVNEVGPKGRDTRGCCYGCGQKGHYYRDCPVGTNNPVPPHQMEEGVVGQMQHTLTTTTDITNKMMGELYRQLAAAELKSQLYKRGYKKAKANLAQTGTMTTPTVMTAATTTPVITQIPITTNPTPTTVVDPSLNPVVQLTRVKTEPNTTTGYTSVKRTINIPRGITNAQAYFASKTPTTVVAGTTTAAATTTSTPKSSKGGTQGKVDKRTKNVLGPAKTKMKKKTDTCQSLDTIPEVPTETETEPLIDFEVSESEVEDLCEVLTNMPTETEDEADDSEEEPEF